MVLKKRKAQMKMSFGMIFSIILIIAFLGFTFYAIKFILDLQKTAQLGQAIDEIESDVDGVWKSSQSSKKEEYNIPGKIEYLCFVDADSEAKGDYRDFEDEFSMFYGEGKNMFFYPMKEAGDISAMEIKHLDIEEMTSEDNPYCIEKENGKIEIVLKKEFEENLVRVTSD